MKAAISFGDMILVVSTIRQVRERHASILLRNPSITSIAHDIILNAIEQK